PNALEQCQIVDRRPSPAQKLAKLRQMAPVDEASVSLQKEYILKMDADRAFGRIAVGLSSSAVHVYNVDAAGGLANFCFLPPSESRGVGICGVKFLDEGPDNLLVGTTDGYVKLFDLRVRGEQARFRHPGTTNGLPAVPDTVTCFDSNANGRLLCVGTELRNKMVHLLFFDVRERCFMGQYEESHAQDISAVRFHPRNPDKLITGSVDGLVNQFDVHQVEEDDALEHTVNIESSISRLEWHRNAAGKDVVSCITDIVELHLFDCEDEQSVGDFDREQITAGICRTDPDNCNLVAVHSRSDGEVFLLAGSNCDLCVDILRTASVDTSKLALEPRSDFHGNRQIVRDSLYDEKRDLLVTGGEGGIVTVWGPQVGGATSQVKTSKVKTGRDKRKVAPY
ncbi:hypothetical protein KR018_009146, partial [Drosophila ironensis]